MWSTVEPSEQFWRGKFKLSFDFYQPSLYFNKSGGQREQTFHSFLLLFCVGFRKKFIVSKYRRRTLYIAIVTRAMAIMSFFLYLQLRISPFDVFLKYISLHNFCSTISSLLIFSFHLPRLFPHRISSHTLLWLLRRRHDCFSNIKDIISWNAHTKGEQRAGKEWEGNVREARKIHPTYFTALKRGKCAEYLQGLDTWLIRM